MSEQTTPRTVEEAARGEAERRWPMTDQERAMVSFGVQFAQQAARMPSVEEVAEVLAAHQPTTGMRVASGATCRCGYWNGTEEPGRTRPVGYQGLQWHQAERVVALWRGGERG